MCLTFQVSKHALSFRCAVVPSDTAKERFRRLFFRLCCSRWRPVAVGRILFYGHILMRICERVGWLGEIEARLLG